MILYCATPYNTVGADAARFFLNGRRAGRLVTVLPPYTAHRIHAACFSAMSVGVLGDSLLRYPPTLHIGNMLPVLVR